VENIIRHMEMPENKDAKKGKPLLQLIKKAIGEVSGALTVAMMTTIVSFLPVFAMEAQEGKLFAPLAYTKTFTLGFSFVLGLIILPTLAYFVFSFKINSAKIRKVLNYILIAAGLAFLIVYG